MKLLKIILLFIKAIFTQINGKSLRFTKEDGIWYYDFPNWPFTRSALIMCWGSDTLLDTLNDGSDLVTIKIWKKEVPNAIKLTKYKSSLTEGAEYLVNNHVKILWICPVTLLVLGKYPDELWIQQSS